MGRNTIHDTPEKKTAAHLAAQKKYANKFKQVYLDAETMALLAEQQDILAKTLGFTPTFGQVLRHMLSKLK